MIQSFASEATEHIFFGNWSMTTSMPSLGQLEDCFFDLLFLDAAATTHDLERLFGMRLLPLGGKSGGKYGTIVSAPGGSFTYRVSFVWSGTDADKVFADLSDAKREGD